MSSISIPSFPGGIDMDDIYSFQRLCQLSKTLNNILTQDLFVLFKQNSHSAPPFPRCLAKTSESWSRNSKRVLKYGSMDAISSAREAHSGPKLNNHSLKSSLPEAVRRRESIK